jgi:hypothetical protein
VFDPETKESRVCVQWQDFDEAGALGLEDGAIDLHVPIA